MKWDDIKIFHACMSAGSLSAAAELLDVQQSTVSRRIQALEERLGASLFIRTSEGIIATSLAEKLASEADAMQAHFHTFERLATSHDPEVRGEVRISLVEPMALYLLLPQIEEFKQRYPALTLDLVTDYAVADLDRLEADIALRFMRPDRGDLMVKKLIEMPLKLLASRDYLERYGAPTRERGRWVNVRLPGIVTPEDEWYAEHVHIAPWLQTSSYVVAAEAILSGQCAGLTTGLLAEVGGERLRSFTLEGADLPPDLEVWLVTHAAMRDTPRVATVCDWLCELFEAAGSRQ